MPDLGTLKLVAEGGAIIIAAFLVYLLKGKEDSMNNEREFMQEERKMMQEERRMNNEVLLNGLNKISDTLSGLDKSIQHQTDVMNNNMTLSTAALNSHAQLLSKIFDRMK